MKIRMVAAIAALLLSSVAPSVSAAPFAYAADGDTNNGLLYRIDLANNSIATVGNVTGLIEALSFGPNGQLFGVDEDASTLVQINTANAATSVVGSLGMAAEDPGLAFCRDTQQMFLANENGDVYTVNTATGAATLLGASGIAEISGLACLNGTLFAASDDSAQLFRVNRATGAGTLVGNFGIAVGGDIGLASDGSRLLMVIDDGTDAPFYSVNPSTGVANLIATFPGIQGLESLAAEGEARATGATQVPTLPLYGVFALALFAALIGFQGLRRRR
jgi:hypothetical protein